MGQVNAIKTPKTLSLKCRELFSKALYFMAAQDPISVRKYIIDLSKEARLCGEDAFADTLDICCKNLTKTILPSAKDEELPLCDLCPYSPDNEQAYADNYAWSKGARQEMELFAATFAIKDQLQEMDALAPHTLLLCGPPGCGKTSMARCIAHQMQKTLLIIRLEAVISSLLGNTSKNLSKIFDYAADNDAVLFLDEFDAVARRRDEQSNDVGEMKRIVNALLQSMDRATALGCSVIAATNHEELLDNAIWRRFSSVMRLTPPKNSEEIIALLTVLFRRKPIDFDLKDDQVNALLIKTFQGVSPSDARTTISMAIRDMLLAQEKSLSLERIISRRWYSGRRAVEDKTQRRSELNEFIRSIKEVAKDSSIINLAKLADIAAGMFI